MMKTKLSLTLTAILLVLALGSKVANAVNINIRVVSQAELADEALKLPGMSLTREEALDLVQKSGEAADTFRAKLETTTQEALAAVAQLVDEEVGEDHFRSLLDRYRQRTEDAFDVLLNGVRVQATRERDIELSYVTVSIGEAKQFVQAEYNRSGRSTQEYKTKERKLSELERLWRNVAGIYNTKRTGPKYAKLGANHKIAAALEHFTSPEIQTILLNSIDYQNVYREDLENLQVSLDSAKDYAQYIIDEQARVAFIANIDVRIAKIRATEASRLISTIEDLREEDKNNYEVALEIWYALFRTGEHDGILDLYWADRAQDSTDTEEEWKTKNAIAYLKGAIAYGPLGYESVLLDLTEEIRENGVFTFVDNTGAYGTHTQFGISKNGLGLILDSNDTLSMARTYVTYSPLKGLDTRLQVGVIEGKGSAEGAKANELQLGINYNLPKAGVKIRSELTENSLTGTSANIQLGISW